MNGEGCAAFWRSRAGARCFPDLVNTGIYILEPELLSLLPKEGPYDFGKQLFPAMVEKGLPLYGYVAKGYWCDIGDSAQYLRAHMDALAGRIRGFEPKVEEGALVEDGVQLQGPVWIGKGSRVCEGARLGPFAVVGRDCCVRPSASVRASVLWDGVLVGERAELRGALALDGAQVLRGGQMYEGSVLGSGAVLGEGASLADGAMVWPGKRVDAGDRLRGSLVRGRAPLRWDSRGVYARQRDPARARALLRPGQGSLAAPAAKEGFAPGPRRQRRGADGAVRPVRRPGGGRLPGPVGPGRRAPRPWPAPRTSMEPAARPISACGADACAWTCTTARGWSTPWRKGARSRPPWIGKRRPALRWSSCHSPWNCRACPPCG